MITRPARDAFFARGVCGRTCFPKIRLHAYWQCAFYQYYPFLHAPILIDLFYNPRVRRSSGCLGVGWLKTTRACGVACIHEDAQDVNLTTWIYKLARWCLTVHWIGIVGCWWYISGTDTLKLKSMYICMCPLLAGYVGEFMKIRRVDSVPS